MQTIPTFNNRPNEAVTLQDGRQIWIARSCAVVVEICAYVTTTQTWYILLGQRGTGVPDFQGYWGLPCGYLDWDETLCQAAVREVWEECGLYLPALNQQAAFGFSASSLVQAHSPFSDTPWAITDNIPNEGKQNISMHYAVLFSWHSHTLPALSSAHCEPNEVAGLAWVEINSAKTQTLAFNHQTRIQKLCDELTAQMQAVTQAR